MKHVDCQIPTRRERQPGDAEAVRRLAEEGASIRLLCNAWMVPDCGLPGIKSGPKLRQKFDGIDGRLFGWKAFGRR